MIQVIIWLLFCLLPTASVAAIQLTEPEVLDSRFELSLFASEPAIVTPIGATIDHMDRLLVIESHTHQRPKDYKGPAKDRILIVQDLDKDGTADSFVTFFQGTTHTMSIRAATDGWLYVATRAEIFRLRDNDGDDVADQRQQLIRLETKGDYPHNGLCGLALTPHGQLLFGMGENLGVKYRMVAADGSAASGSGQGGVFQCDLQGNQLKRLATGFWNPFGICVDANGHIFAVGNDADSRPPSRLVHIVPTGDYGFQYRYGRSGIHPLQAWDGELAGTLPMVSGTGEAPCELIEYQDGLVTGSWGDFRVEWYQRLPVGASFVARRKILVQGDENFRPVAFAHAANGDLYFTDWVDKSYPVHGKGRIWRLKFKGETKVETKRDSSSRQPAALSAIQQRARDAVTTVDWPALASDDRFLRQFAIAGLVDAADKGYPLTDQKLNQFPDQRTRLAVLQAMRWYCDHGRADALPAPLDRLREALNDSDPNVRLLAVRWVADQRIKELLPELERQLSGFQNTSSSLFLATIAAMEFLKQGTSSFDSANSLGYFVATVTDTSVAPEIRAMALRMIPVNNLEQEFSIEELASMVFDGPAELQREVVRSVALINLPGRDKALARIADADSVDLQARADARWRLDIRPPQVVAETVQLGADLQSWNEEIEKAGDPVEGWRQFYHPGRMNCATCHSVRGRGGKTGPDLTGIVARTSRSDVLDSILNPSRNIAPRYVTTTLVTEDGRTRTGLFVGHSADGTLERYQDNEGQIFSVDPDDIQEKRLGRKSIMPERIHHSMTIEQIRDLLAFLQQE